MEMPIQRLQLYFSRVITLAKDTRLVKLELTIMTLIQQIQFMVHLHIGSLTCQVSPYFCFTSFHSS